jgi:tetratricopeptide (TPR) repeat protein
MMRTIGSVDKSLGLMKAAVPLLEEALRIREKILGPNHPDVAQSLMDLDASTPDETLALQRRALAIREKSLGPDHPDVAYNLWSIGCVLNWKGDYKAARQSLEHAQAIFEKKLGPDDIGVSWCLTDIANGMLYGGDYAGARPRFERALQIKEKKLAPDHPDVAIGLQNLGWVLTLLGDYETARPILERSVAICEKVKPAGTASSTAESCTDLGECLHRMHRDLEAKPILEHALAIEEKEERRSTEVIAEGEPWPSTLNSLGAVLTELGETVRAEACFKRALKLGEKRLNPNDPDVAGSLEGYAALLRKAGRAAEAAPLEARAQAIRAAQPKVEEPGTTRKGSGS